MSISQGGGHDDVVSSPVAEAITPGNSGTGAANGEVLAPKGNRSCRALYIGGPGDVSVTMAGDGKGANKDNIIFAGAVAGSVLPIQVSRVRATGTTASSIVALY